MADIVPMNNKPYDWDKNALDNLFKYLFYSNGRDIRIKFQEHPVNDLPVKATIIQKVPIYKTTWIKHKAHLAEIPFRNSCSWSRDRLYLGWLEKIIESNTYVLSIRDAVGHVTN